MSAPRPRQFASALITGGAGFIGTHVISLLAKRCRTITVYDNLHEQVHGAGAPLPDFGPACRFVRGDICDATLLNDIVAAAAPDLVVHLAAETGTGQSYDDVAHHCSINVVGTAHLAEAIRRLPTRDRRVVLASSRAVYGEGLYRDPSGVTFVPPPRSAAAMSQGRFLPEAEDGTALEPLATPETAPPSPASIYASSKLMQEFVLRQAFDGTAIDLAILRFQNVYGAGQSVRNPYTGVLTIFAQMLQEGKALDIFEDGNIARDFVHVKDAARAIVAAADATPVPGTAINVGSGHAATIKGVADILLRMYGKGPQSLVVSGRFRSGDVRHCRADIALAREALGWHPRIGLEEGLADLVDWVRSGAPPVPRCPVEPAVARRAAHG